MQSKPDTLRHSSCLFTLQFKTLSAVDGKIAKLEKSHSSRSPSDSAASKYFFGLNSEFTCDLCKPSFYLKSHYLISNWVWYLFATRKIVTFLGSRRVFPFYFQKWKVKISVGSNCQAVFIPPSVFAIHYIRQPLGRKVSSTCHQSHLLNPDPSFGMLLKWIMLISQSMAVSS